MFYTKRPELSETLRGIVSVEKLTRTLIAYDQNVEIKVKPRRKH